MHNSFVRNKVTYLLTYFSVMLSFTYKVSLMSITSMDKNTLYHCGHSNLFFTQDKCPILSRNVEN